VLDKNAQKYALYLLEHVTPSQRWGVSGGGRNYLMAVLSTGNPSQEYGIDTLNHLGAMVWSTLAPHR